MGIGLGVLLLVLGAIVTWVIQVDIPGIDQYLLGIILMVAGVAVIILSFVVGAMRGSRSTRVTDVNGTQAVTETSTKSTTPEM